MRLLVVDDFRTMRRVLRGLLRDMGLDDVAEAGDGAAALERLRAEPVDLVITDIEMPTLNGFELLSAIKKDERLKHVPVLMLAAEARKDEIVRRWRAGVLHTIQGAGQGSDGVPEPDMDRQRDERSVAWAERYRAESGARA